MRTAHTQIRSDGELFSIIENGIRLTGMPAWGDGTPESEKASWVLVHFIRRIPKLTPADLDRMKALNPRTPAEFRAEEAARAGKEPPPATASQSRAYTLRRSDTQVPSRRTFVRGLAAAGAAVSAGVLPGGAWASPPQRLPHDELSGTEFDLRIGETAVSITGRARRALTINGSIPGPTLRWREGDTVTMRVSNTLDEATSIHWHGILLPANMDGVPGLSFSGIHPGETFTYSFVVRQSGTYWYDSHSGFQEQRGLYAPLVIQPAEPESFRYDREHVVMLTDWTDEDPRRVFAKLKKQSDYYNFRQRTVGDLIDDVQRDGLWPTLSARSAWGRMRMSDRDLADVTGATYTYLMNGQPPASGWTGLFRPGERVRLRLINGSAMTYFDVRVPGLKLTIVAADGLPVRPVEVDELRIAVAETYDVLVEPGGADALTIFAQAMDRTGYAAGTLAVREGLRATVPDIDPRPSLSMADMGHGAPADPHAGHVTPTPAEPHAGHVMPSATVTHPETERGIRWWTCRRPARRRGSRRLASVYVTTAGMC